MSDQTFDAPVWHHGKALRKGYTTGSCATAAAKVAALMVMRQHLIHQVSIVTPSGVTLCLNVESPHVEGQQAVAAIRKDGGDDVDATHGMLIFARVTLNDSGEISLQGGEGIGTVTRKGIGLPTGSPAINRTPRHTIETAVREAIGPTRGAQVEIFAPEGALRAQKTYNARLGILGGISIIGTTGIVTPMSEESWKRSLSLELEIKRAAGLERVVLVPGNHGERFVREQMGIDPQMVVTMSNFVGYMIEEAARFPPDCAHWPSRQTDQNRRRDLSYPQPYRRCADGNSRRSSGAAWRAAAAADAGQRVRHYRSGNGAYRRLGIPAPL